MLQVCAKEGEQERERGIRYASYRRKALSRKLFIATHVRRRRVLRIIVVASKGALKAQRFSGTTP